MYLQTGFRRHNWNISWNISLNTGRCDIVCYAQGSNLEGHFSRSLAHLNGSWSVHPFQLLEMFSRNCSDYWFSLHITHFNHLGTTSSAAALFSACARVTTSRIFASANLSGAWRKLLRSARNWRVGLESKPKPGNQYFRSMDNNFGFAGKNIDAANLQPGAPIQKLSKYWLKKRCLPPIDWHCAWQGWWVVPLDGYHTWKKSGNMTPKKMLDAGTRA